MKQDTSSYFISQCVHFDVNGIKNVIKINVDLVFFVFFDQRMVDCWFELVVWIPGIPL